MTEKCGFVKYLVDLIEFVRFLAEKKWKTKTKKNYHENKKAHFCLKLEVGIDRFISLLSQRYVNQNNTLPNSVRSTSPLYSEWEDTAPQWSRTDTASVICIICCPKKSQWQAAPSKLPHTYNWLNNRKRSSLTPAMFLKGLQNTHCLLVIICQHTRQTASFKQERNKAPQFPGECVVHPVTRKD